MSDVNQNTDTPNSEDETSEQESQPTNEAVRDAEVQAAFEKASDRVVPATDVNAETGEPAKFAGEPQTNPLDRDDPRNYEQTRTSAPGSLPEGEEEQTIEKATAFIDQPANEGKIGEDLPPSEEANGQSVADNNIGSAGSEGDSISPAGDGYPQGSDLPDNTPDA